MEDGRPSPNPYDATPGRPQYVLISRYELDLIKSDLHEAKMAAQAAATTSASNKQTLDEVVKPALGTLEKHEEAIQRARGAMFGIGAVWSVITLFLSLVVGWMTSK